MKYVTYWLNMRFRKARDDRNPDQKHQEVIAQAIVCHFEHENSGLSDIDLNCQECLKTVY